MKKAITLCAAAMLTISATATAYAAPLSIPTTGKVIVCNQDTVTETLKNSLWERLAACLPSLPVKPDTSKPDTDTSKPDTDTSKPDTDTSKPDTDTSKPDTGTSKPDTNTSNTGTQDVSAYAKQVVTLVNQERAKVGLPALTLDTTASKAAQVRANEIRTSFSHTRPNGSSCFTALKEAGVSYRTAGENIAAGQKTPEQVVAAWMNSEGHRKNILGSQYTAIGVGYLAEGNCWTQFFIG